MPESATVDRPDRALLPADADAAAALDIVLWPDPRLRKKCLPVADFDADTTRRLDLLVARMAEVMEAEKGVGLAAPQVGVNVRLFIMHADDDLKVYVNPRLSDPDGSGEAEEGCLSLPDIRTPVLRSNALRIEARTTAGEPIDETGEGFVPRVWQHETDHLDGVLILDKMPETVRMGHRRVLSEMEAEYSERHPKPDLNAKAQRRQRAAKKRRK